MGTFKVYLKKEMLESVRSYRYVVLAVGILFFALMDPIMVKLLPELLKGKMDTKALSTLIEVSREAALRNYVKDMFQFGTIFVIFTMAGMLSDERKKQKLVFPFAKGASPAGVVLAKLLHYILVVVAMTMLGVYMNWVYAGVLMEGAELPFRTVVFVGAMLAVYFTFNMVVALFFSSVFSKGLAAGFVTLILSYVSYSLLAFDSIKKFLPSVLLENASGLKVVDSWTTVVTLLGVSVVLVAATIWKMNRTEVI